MSKNNKKKSRTESDEVEELLRATEDEMVLKMSLNSHMARGSSSQIIDPDLDLRFQTLKSNKKSNIKKTQLQNPIKTTPIDVNINDYDDEDLFARFASLKKSLPCYQNQPQVKEGVQDEDDDDDDEVEKVIKWAMDAARLDPSPESDSDEEKDDDDDDDDDESVEKGKKGKGR